MLTLIVGLIVLAIAVVSVAATIRALATDGYRRVPVRFRDDQRR